MLVSSDVFCEDEAVPVTVTKILLQLLHAERWALDVRRAGAS